MLLDKLNNAILIWGPLNEAAIAYLEEQGRMVVVPEMRPSCLGLLRVIPALKEADIPALYCTDNMMGLLFMKKKITQTLIVCRKEDRKGLWGISGTRYIGVLSRLHGVKIKLLKAGQKDYNTVSKDIDASTIQGKKVCGQTGPCQAVPATEEYVLFEECGVMKDKKNGASAKNVVPEPDQKKAVIFWSGLLHQKNLLSAGSGNVSCRNADGTLSMTAHHSYLGFLTEEDIVTTDAQGLAIEGTREATSEKALHAAVYRQFPDVAVVLHAHSPFTVAYFNEHDDIEYISFECKFYLGKVPVVPQDTPTVTDVQPVLEALTRNKIIVLKNHGVVAIGKEFKEAYSLIELLEQQCYVRILTRAAAAPACTQPSAQGQRSPEKPLAYELFSEDHVRCLTEVCNNDKKNQELGKKYNLNTTLAVKNVTNGKLWCFHYMHGKIHKCDTCETAEFLITAAEDVWKKIFNRQIDPFVASTQGLIKIKGDFNKMSAWFPVFERTFKLWEQAPVT